LHLKSFAQVELSYYCHQRDGLRPGPIADANESLRTATSGSGGEMPTRNGFWKIGFATPAPAW
jgi:hypothetical protein